MTVTYATDVTHGKYISNITAGGISWDFMANPIWEGYCWADPPGIDNILLPHDFFTLTASGPTLGLTTLQYDGIGAIAGLRIKLYIQETATGITCKAPEIALCPAGLSMKEIKFPIFRSANHGLAANSYGVLGGALIPLPHTRIDAGGALSIIPPSLMYEGLYDSASKEGLMIWCEDEVGHAMQMKMTGHTFADSTVMYLNHYMDRRYTTGAVAAKTYLTKVEPLLGISVDGRMCYQDFNEKYREWFGAAARPWYRRWATDATVSPRIKTKGMVLNTAKGSALLETEITSLATYLGNEKLLVRWRFDDGTFVDHPPDSGMSSLDSEYLTAMENLRQSSIDVSVYTITRQWLSTLTSPFDPDSFSTYGDLKPMMVHNKDGSARQDGNGMYAWDFTHASSDDVQLELIDSYWAMHTGEKPSGIYLDNYTPHFSTSFGMDIEDLAADTTWTYALHRAGIASTMTAVKAQLAGDVENPIVGCEVVDLSTVKIADLIGIWKPYHNYEAGNDTRSQTYVSGHICRAAKLDGVGLSEGGVDFLYATRQAVTRDWLATGIAAVSDVSAGNDIIATPPNVGIYAPVWTWVKQLVDLATGPAKKYFEGKRVRGLPDDFVIALDNTDYTNFEEARIAFECGAYPIQTAIHQSVGGDLGIIVAHCFKTGMTSTFNPPTPGPRTVPITIVPAAYDLDAGTYALVQDGEILEIFFADETFETEVTVEEDTVSLFEVVKIGETRIDVLLDGGSVTIVGEEAQAFVGFDLTLSGAAGPVTIAFKSSETDLVYHTAVFSTSGHIFLRGVAQTVPAGEGIKITGGASGAIFTGSVYWSK